MALLMRDSVDAAAIPLDGLAAVAGYGDGEFVWSSASWSRFPPPIVPLSIVVTAADAGDILDVETSDATPADCPGWADRFNRPARRRPTIYCSRETIAAVRAAMGSRPFDWWAATLDDTTTNTDGAAAVQLRGAAQTGGNYDESVILDPSWIGGSMAATLDSIASQLTQLQDGLVSVWLFLLQGFDAPPAGSPAGTPPQHDSILLGINSAVQALAGRADATPAVAAVKAELDQLKAEVEAGGSVDAAAAISRIEAAVKGAGSALAAA